MPAPLIVVATPCYGGLVTQGYMDVFGKHQYALFECMIDPRTGVYLSQGTPAP